METMICEHCGEPFRMPPGEIVELVPYPSRALLWQLTALFVILTGTFAIGLLFGMALS